MILDYVNSLQSSLNSLAPTYVTSPNFTDSKKNSRWISIQYSLSESVQDFCRQTTSIYDIEVYVIDSEQKVIQTMYNLTNNVLSTLNQFSYVGVRLNNVLLTDAGVWLNNKLAYRITAQVMLYE